MKTYQAKEDMMIQHIKEQLHQLGYTDTENKTKRELVSKLAYLRVIDDNPNSGWF